jgi:hypothetical protein
VTMLSNDNLRYLQVPWAGCRGKVFEQLLQPIALKASDTHCWTECRATWREIDQSHYVPSNFAHLHTIHWIPDRGHKAVPESGGSGGGDEPVMVSFASLQAGV